MKRWQSGIVKAGLILTYLIPHTVHGITEQDRINGIQGQINSLKTPDPDAAVKELEKQLSTVEEFGKEIKGWEKWKKDIETSGKIKEKSKKKLEGEISKRENDLKALDKAAKGIVPGQNTNGDIGNNLRSASQFEACKFNPDTSYEADVNALSSLASNTKKDISDVSAQEREKLEKEQEKFEAEGIAKLLASASQNSPSTVQQVAKLAEKFSDPSILIDAIRKDKELLKEKALQERVKAIEEFATTLKLTRKLKKGDSELSKIATEKSEQIGSQGNAALDKFAKSIMGAQAACENAKKTFKKLQAQERRGLEILQQTQNVTYNIEGEMSRFRNTLSGVDCDVTFAFQALSDVKTQLANAANRVGNEGQNPSKLRVAYLEAYKVVPEGLKKVSEAVRDTINAQCAKLGDAMKSIEEDPTRQQAISAGKGGADASQAASPAPGAAAGATGGRRNPTPTATGRHS